MRARLDAYFLLMGQLVLVKATTVSRAFLKSESWPLRPIRSVKARSGMSRPMPASVPRRILGPCLGDSLFVFAAVVSTLAFSKALRKGFPFGSCAVTLKARARQSPSAERRMDGDP